MTFVITKLLIVTFLSCVRSQRFYLNKNISFTKQKYSSEIDPSSLIPLKTYLSETNRFDTLHPQHAFKFQVLQQHSSSAAHLNAINKRQLSLVRHKYVTPALHFGIRKPGIWTTPVLYGKLLKQNINTHENQNLSMVNTIRANKEIPSLLGQGNLKAPLDKKKKLLQSINNPLIYKAITKPITLLIDPTISTSIYPFYRRTNSPMTMNVTVPHYLNNEDNTTPKLVQKPNYSKYEEWNSNMYSNYEVMAKFIQALDILERQFYKVCFEKLTSISPADRIENGISFAQTGLFLQMALMALSSEVDTDTRNEIEECIGLKLTNTEKKYIIREIMSSLPKSSEALKFRLSSRLVVRLRQHLKPQFQRGLAPALQLHIDRINATDTAEALTAYLNKMIEKDSGGAMRDTFEEDEFSDGICAILATTMYLRARWRSAPTVLNGTHAFHDDVNAPSRSARMIRINDIMRYTELHEWDAEAIEISYATPGLSLLLLIPRGRSLRRLASHLAETSIHRVLEQMYSLRVAVTLPLFTLRMTLLLPGKLQSMCISRLVDVGESQCGDLRLSHAVQRLMFWAEAGRNAFKDDGIEWDEAPELDLVVNRPYAFFVRWRNLTIMNGNFVL